MDIRELSEKEILKVLESRIGDFREEVYCLEEEITELRQKLFDSESLKTKFLSIIRNELKNPLAAITGLSKMVAEKRLSNEMDVEKVVKTIQAESKRFAMQLDNILMAASLEGGEESFFKTSFDSGVLIDEALSAYENDIKEKKIEFLKDIEYGLFVFSDREKIKLVFKNLIDNSVKFCSKKVGIKLKKDDDKISFSFFNDGIEIEKNFHFQIFERFRPGDTNISRIYSGVGLGLSVSSTIIDNSCGSIDFHSGEGTGTEFIVILPLINKPEQNSESDVSDEGFIKL